jgi:hypothetical protein
LAELAHSEGEAALAQQLHEQALRMYQALGTPKGTAYALLEMGDKEQIRGDLVRARELHEQATAIWRGLDDRYALGVELSNLGSVLTPLGELERSRAVSIESLAILMELRSGTAVFPLMNLGIVACALGQPVQAARLLGAAEAARRPLGWGINVCLRRAYQNALSSLRVQLGESGFASAWREGEALSLEHAAALAMADERVGAEVRGPGV